MYRTAKIPQHFSTLRLDAKLYEQMGDSIHKLEARHGRRVSEAEFIRRAIQKACEEIEDSSGFQVDSE